MKRVLTLASLCVFAFGQSRPNNQIRVQQKLALVIGNGAYPGNALKNPPNSNEKPAHEVEITKGFWLGETEVTQAAYERVLGGNPSHFKGPNLPVETVSWEDARDYCAAIGGRLPTESEWEYAARAGTTGSRSGDLDEVAWYSVNSGGQTHVVRGKKPNAWGLYDMLGNVWEWTADAYDANTKTVRGGSWFIIPLNPRVSGRGWSAPSVRTDNNGVRCAWE